MFFHVPNQGRRHVNFLNKLIRMGMRPGVSDLLFLKDGKFYALELKAVGGRPTLQQLQFMDDVRSAGGYAVICEGLDQALQCLETWKIIRGTNVQQRTKAEQQVRT